MRGNDKVHSYLLRDKPERTGQLTSDEVLVKYPQLVKQMHWKNSDITALLKMRILTGMRITPGSGSRTTYVDEDSVVRLLKFVNDGLEAQKIQLVR